MARTLLPPGFRFHPTDVELVMYYLKRKVLGRKLHFEAIAELNIYKFSPWDLPDKSSLKTKDREWYFFVPIERKYASGVRMNRATETGYWKTTGRDRPVQYNENVVGKVRTLIFHLGYAPHGERTDWVIHEYKMEDKSLAANEVALGAYVLCKVFHKNGPGPKNGAQYGALFEEEDWNDDFAIPLPFLPVVELQKNLNQNTSAALSIVDPSHSPGLPGPSMIQASREDALLNGERLSIVTSTVNPVHTLSSREVGLSLSAHSAQDMVLDSEHVDIAHLLASLDGDPLPLTWNWNANNEAHLDSGRETQLVPNSSLNDPFSGLEDLDGLANPNSSGLDFSYTAFLELDDLNAPLNSGARVGEMLANGFYSPCNFTGSEYVLPETTQSTFSVYDPHPTYLHQLPYGFNSSEIQENSSLVPMGQNCQPAYPRYCSNLIFYQPEENNNCRESGKR